MLFNFHLRPLKQVVPWGPPGNQSLHWFGLTDGEYWIQVGAEALFEYSEAARTHFGWSRYCDYQVARLYEDITEMLPFVLDPVPASLVPYISGDSGSAWTRTYETWFSNPDPSLSEDQFWSIADAASMWISHRTLATHYLRPSTGIVLWSDAGEVHIEWDNTGKTVEGKPAWAALSGSAHLSREEFIREVRAFHAALMTEMEARVEHVMSGALPEEVQIDLPGLQREHAIRSSPLEREFNAPQEPTDWERVRRAIQEVERWHSTEGGEPLFAGHP